MKGAAEVLRRLGIGHSVHLLSAHRVPALLARTIEGLEAGGCDCYIAGAGLAAHLPGVIASRTLRPVIGVPVRVALEGLDSLLSIVQMPKGVPVATVAIDNAWNAGILAAQILSLKYPGIRNASPPSGGSRPRPTRGNRSRGWSSDGNPEPPLRGKAKKVYATDDPELVVIHYKDDATAFNGEKKGSIEDKGQFNNAITAALFALLAGRGCRPTS